MQQTDDCAGSDAKIAVRDLTKMYGDLTVLDKVNFTIKRGELVCIVGPTGCGKTTFLNCMSKLTESTSGKSSRCSSYGSAEQYRDEIKHDLNRYGTVVKAAGISIE